MGGQENVVHEHLHDSEHVRGGAWQETEGAAKWEMKGGAVFIFLFHSVQNGTRLHTSLPRMNASFTPHTHA